MDSRGDPAELRTGCLFTGEHTLYAVAEGFADDADVAHEVLEALRLERCGLVAAPHRAIERDVPLDRDRSECDRGERDLQPPLVARVPDRHTGVAQAQRLDHAE